MPVLVGSNQKTFGRSSHLERHCHIHAGERPFICYICQKHFNQKNALDVHLQNHNSEKPYQKGNLKMHMQRAHPGASLSAVDQMTEQGESSEHADRKHCNITIDLDLTCDELC
jgi:hypothetical protein